MRFGSSNWLAWSLALLTFHVSFSLAVKDYLFKTCDQSGFCQRNRHLASSIEDNKSFVSPYAIDPTTLRFDSENSVLAHGDIIKTLPDQSTRHFPFEISLLDGNILRIRADEEVRNATEKLPGVNSKYVNQKRYDEVPKWAFKDTNLPLKSTQDTHIDLDEHRLIFKYGDNHKYEANLSFHPIKLTVSFKGQEQLVLNEKQFLNIEHYRTRQDKPADHLYPTESSYNMFEDDFNDSKNDKIPLGPESLGLDFSFKNFKHVFGIPEHADSLSLKDTTKSDLPYRLYNVDIFEYETHSRMPMYGSIPLLTAAKPDVSVGVFWVNSADTFIDINKQHKHETSAHWMSENGVLDVMIFIGDKPDDINKSYGLVTGYANLPQLFSLGYHQCRWNYNDEQDVLNINRLFDENQIPYDTIWLDIGYADQKKYFTWQPDNFPDPARMLGQLDHTGRNLVIIIDPHIKTGYSVSDELKKQQITIKEPDNNSTFHGHCWPGESVWIDTMNPSSQAFWDKKHELSTSNKFFGELSTNVHLWNDMNEPSVFDGPETSSPRDNLHYGDWEHRSVHNLFGLTFHDATYKSLVKRLSTTNRQRPFILTRSYFAGSQRTAAMWTGDNMSKWEYLKISIPMVLTSNVVGMPFAGSDVGGFFGNPSKELLTRWYQTGIWYPFFRAHAHIDSRRREPWVPGEPFTSYIRDALRLRYALLSVFYTEFHQHSIDGTPVMKPMYYENPENEDTYDIDDQFFLGDSGLMVKPVTDEGATSVNVYIPDSQVYYQFNNGQANGEKVQVRKPGYIEVDVGLQDIPMFIKGGSILATKQRYRRSSKLMYRDPYTLFVALNSDGVAHGQLYIDDGESFGYENGEYVVVDFKASLKEGFALSAHVTGGGSGAYVESLGGIGIEKIVLLGADNDIAEGSTLVRVQQEDSDKINVFKDGQTLVLRSPVDNINSDWVISQRKAVVEHDEL